MHQAEKFRRPVVCFVDTSGAFCGIGAEERGQGQAIAENLIEMMGLKTPVISVLIGEGGSGGALALSVADRVWILENAVYSVVSPGGLREHPVEGREAREGRGGVPAADRAGYGAARRRRAGHQRGGKGHGVRPRQGNARNRARRPVRKDGDTPAKGALRAVSKILKAPSQNRGNAKESLSARTFFFFVSTLALLFTENGEKIAENTL